MCVFCDECIRASIELLGFDSVGSYVADSFPFHAASGVVNFSASYSGSILGRFPLHSGSLFDWEYTHRIVSAAAVFLVPFLPSSVLPQQASVSAFLVHLFPHH